MDINRELALQHATVVSPLTKPIYRTRAGWKAFGYRVPAKATPEKYEGYNVPGYRGMRRVRHLFAETQVVNDLSRHRSISRKTAYISKGLA